MTADSFFSDSLDLMLDFHKKQSMCFAGSSFMLEFILGIQRQVEAITVKMNLVTVISGNIEAQELGHFWFSPSKLR